LSPREQQIGLAWVTHLRECVNLELPVSLLEEKYRITLLYLKIFTEKC
jgi:hypothetical protein